VPCGRYLGLFARVSVRPETLPTSLGNRLFEIGFLPAGEVQLEECDLRAEVVHDSIFVGLAARADQPTVVDLDPAVDLVGKAPSSKRRRHRSQSVPRTTSASSQSACSSSGVRHASQDIDPSSRTSHSVASSSIVQSIRRQQRTQVHHSPISRTQSPHIGALPGRHSAARKGIDAPHRRGAEPHLRPDGEGDGLHS